MVRRIGFVSIDGTQRVFICVGDEFHGGGHKATVTKLVPLKGAVPAFEIHMSDGEVVRNVGVPYSAVFTRKKV